MLYPTNMQNTNFKYFLFSSKKYLNMKNKLEISAYSDPQFCHYRDLFQKKIEPHIFFRNLH